MKKDAVVFIWVSQKFSNILWHARNSSSRERYPLWLIVLTHALLNSVCDLKAAQVNVQHNLIWERMLYKFKLSHDTADATRKHLCKMWRCSWLQYNNWMVEEISLGLQKNLMIRQRSGQLKTLESKAVLQAIEVNPASSTYYQNIVKLLTHSCVKFLACLHMRKIFSCLQFLTKILLRKGLWSL